MTAYIRRSDIADRIDYYASHSVGGEHYAYEVCQKEIKEAPSADVTELTHGTWIPVNKQQSNPTDGFWTERYLQCSECNYERRHSWLRVERPPYCELCGAKMDGGNEDGK